MRTTARHTDTGILYYYMGFIFLSPSTSSNPTGSRIVHTAAALAPRGKSWGGRSGKRSPRAFLHVDGATFFFVGVKWFLQ